MALNDAALNAATDAITGLISATSLHSADPGTTGANELSGGSYAQQTPSFASASGGEADLTSGLTFNVASGSTVAYYGHWDGSTFLGGDAVSTTETYASDGTYVLSSAAVKVQ